MSGYILCQTRRASTPFFIENISLNIYSIEELCYYLYNNLYLVDETLVNEKLCAWIENELYLPALASKLRRQLGKYMDIADVVYPVFKEINYLTYEELKSLNVRLQRMNTETAITRDKKKGDSMIRNGMYVNAIKVYQKLIETCEAAIKEKQGDEIVQGSADAELYLLPSVYHNLGCAYAHLFQMEKAVECFEGALKYDWKESRLMTYLCAFRMLKSKAALEGKMANMELPEEFTAKVREKAEAMKNLEIPEVTPANAGDILKDLTREYHRSTGA